MEHKERICPNCEQAHDESFDFCPNCGQKTKDDLTLGVLFYNTISNYFSFDARFLKSFLPLIIKPGFLAKKFLEGKRLLYLHPAQMYLFISVIFFFLFSFVVREQAELVDRTINEDLANSERVIDSLRQTGRDSVKIEEILAPVKKNQKALGLDDSDLIIMDSIVNKSKGQSSRGDIFRMREIDSMIAANTDENEIYKTMGMDDNASMLTKKFYAQLLKFYKNRNAGSILKSFYDSIPIAMFFLLPIFAFMLKILYFRKGTFAHHLVFSFYFFSFLFTVFCILLICNFIWDKFPVSVTLLIILSTYFYLLFAIRRFYEQGWFKSVLKSSIATFSFMAVVLPVSVVVMGVMAFLFY